MKELLDLCGSIVPYAVYKSVEIGTFIFCPYCKSIGQLTTAIGKSDLPVTVWFNDHLKRWI